MENNNKILIVKEQGVGDEILFSSMYNDLKCVRVKAGELIFTPPMEDHATVFLEDCELLAMSRNPRDQEAYEEDVRRVNLINAKDVVE